MKLAFLIVSMGVLLLLDGCGKDESPWVIDPITVKTIDSQPDWSSDGETIAFAHWFNTEIWLLDLETMDRQFLTPGSWPRWSHDGQKIAYVKSDDVHVIDVESGQITRLTNWGSCYYPSWSPDGEKIVFDTSHGDSAGANVIWIMNADGTDKTDISEHGTGEWRQPDWSSGGSEILHIRYVTGGHPGPDLFIMDLSGQDPVRVTNNDRDDHDPRWSPDGTKIAWGSYGEGSDPSSGVWVMNADGTDQHLLAQYGSKPSWSPDGSQVVYAGYNEDSDTVTLWVVNADGSDPHPLTAPEDYQ